jgi:hypothetical protein
LVVLVAAACALAGRVEPAAATQIVARDATHVTLRVNAKGEALVSYAEAGRTRKLLAWGAVNAIAPTASRAQVAFRLDYDGGTGTHRSSAYAAQFDGGCGRYDGPRLAWLVAACKAADGSYWALQSWQRMLPNLGLAPWAPRLAVRELHLSHWTGELPKLEIHTDWVHSRRFHHLFGRYTYRGHAVAGFASTSTGVPLDTFGRNVFLDTFDSAYGPGWKRENSFLAQTDGGSFCYGFYPHAPYAGYPDVGTRPEGNGKRYRVTAPGPGVTPLVVWEGAGLPDFDASSPEHVALERRMNALQRELAGPHGRCGID